VRKRDKREGKEDVNRLK